MNKRDELLDHVSHPPYPYAHEGVSLDTLREFLANDIEDLKHDDAVNATAIATEKTRATGVEEDLEDRIEDLEDDVTVNATAIATETTRATGVESGLDTRVTANATAIATETTRATGVESGLTSRINEIDDEIDDIEKMSLKNARLVPVKRLSNLQKSSFIDTTLYSDCTLQGCCNIDSGYAFIFSNAASASTLTSVLVTTDTSYSVTNTYVLSGVHTNDLTYYNGYFYMPYSYPNENGKVWKTNGTTTTTITLDLDNPVSAISAYSGGFYLSTSGDYKCYRCDFDFTNLEFLCSEVSNVSELFGTGSSTRTGYRQGSFVIDDHYMRIFWSYDSSNTYGDRLTKICDVTSGNICSTSRSPYYGLGEIEGALFINNTVVLFGYTGTAITREEFENYSYNRTTIPNNLVFEGYKIFYTNDVVTLHIWDYSGSDFTIPTEFAPRDTESFIIRQSGTETCFVRIYSDGSVRFVDVGGSSVTPTSAIGTCTYLRNLDYV